MDDPRRTATERRATLKLGILAVSLLAESRFRALTGAARESLSAGDFAGTDPSPVAQWIAAGRFVEPLVTAIVVGGSLAALAVALHGQRASRRAVAVLLSAVGIHLAVAGPDHALDGAGSLGWPVLALLALAGAALYDFLLTPLALRVCRPRWSIVWISIVGVASVAHLAQIFQRGSPPLHDARVVSEWLVERDADVEARGDIRRGALGELRLAANATLATSRAVDGWVVREDAARLESAAPLALDATAPTRLVDAAALQTRRDPSVRSTPDALSLITIAVDGLRGADLDEWLRAGTAPRAIQSCAESGTFYPDFIAPTSDPRRNEAALLGGVHPADLGAAPLPRHLALELGAAGFRTAAFVEGDPRSGAAHGFATCDVRLGDATIERAIDYLRAHAAERFHLHVSLERLELERNWEDGANDRLAPRPEEDPGLHALRRTALERLRRYAVSAQRVLDPDPLDSAWRRHLEEAHRRRTRALLEDVGRLVEEVDAQGLGARAVLVLVGTSGIALGGRAHLGYGQDVDLPSVRVPLVLRAPGLDTGIRLPGARALVDVAPALAEELGVPWPGPRGALDWRALDAPDVPMHVVASRGVWDGVEGRRIHGLVEREFLLHWCPDAEADPASLPGHGPWRLFRTDTDDGRAVDLALVPRYEAELTSLKADLMQLAAEHTDRREAAEGRLAPWARDLPGVDAR